MVRVDVVRTISKNPKKPGKSGIKPEEPGASQKKERNRSKSIALQIKAFYLAFCHMRGRS